VESNVCITIGVWQMVKKKIGKTKFKIPIEEGEKKMAYSMGRSRRDILFSR